MSSLRLFAVLVVAFSLAGCITTVHMDAPVTVASSVDPSHGATGFLNGTVVVDGQPSHYVLYVPREYTPEKEWPLVVFLHGAGERGDTGLLQTEVGIASAIRRWPERFPCLVLMPQCPEEVWWDEALASVEKCLDATLAKYAVDKERISLTGLSMGGYATWQYGAKAADRFSALMPICGAGKLEDAERLTNIPIWAFHGAKDTVVPVERSREMVEAVENAGGTVRYTEYPELGHNSWDAAYGDPKAIKWLLKAWSPGRQERRER